ncbi:Pseudouridine synthase family protein [Thalictrum thalictroides]|uniref:Pseudouridine synthase family protein n=1 Tax=Thalictrum thalictroides TaxID=46969 RepID=A0A7J6VFV2_THATH|nr:Pseudouridine synthase family protein [Thalictrum thalictroides]
MGMSIKVDVFSQFFTYLENVNYYVVHGNTLIQESKKLSVDVSHEDAVGHEERSNVDGTKEFESRERSPGRIAKTMLHAPKRYVAMKIMYFGQRFYGFASQQVEPTIESEIFKALDKTRLLVCDKNESRYTRCGRTDKGVSSVGQVSLLKKHHSLPVPAFIFVLAK